MTQLRFLSPPSGDQGHTTLTHVEAQRIRVSYDLR